MCASSWPRPAAAANVKLSRGSVRRDPRTRLGAARGVRPSFQFVYTIGRGSKSRATAATAERAIERSEEPMHDTPDQVHWHEPKAGENAGYGKFKRAPMPR